MKKKHLFLFFSLLASLSLLYFFLISSNNLPSLKKETSVAKTLKVIPSSDKEILEHFFRYLMIHERFAYTLFGDKPIALHTCPELHDTACDHNTPYLTKKDWQTWEKYKNLFPLTEYCLRRLTSGKKEETSILFIHKKPFLKIVNKHLKLFRNALSYDVTAKELLNTFTSHPRPFKHGIHKHPLLTGILYDCGEKNSTLFFRKKTIEEALIAPQKKVYLRARKEFKSLEDELQHLTQQLRPFSPKDDAFLRLPFFLADPTTQETKALKEKYKHLQQVITPLLLQNDFLEVTLTKLVSF